MTNSYRLTEYSHGAGCGCKIAPDVLSQILKTDIPAIEDPSLLVGNSSRDDAAVYEISPGNCVISTTDFFMPIVDDPFTFGQISATNAISDIYAMGGKPTMAIAILGWPIDKLPPEVAAKVIEGGRKACKEAGILLAGGHSIDAPEPIFGLAVTGTVATANLKQNDKAKIGNKLLLSKPLGVGILTTAEKKKLLQDEHAGVAIKSMCQLNKVGEVLSQSDAVTAMTDVTGFGLLGHLIEICEGSNLDAEVWFNQVPLLENAIEYAKQGSIPGGTHRNHHAYGSKVVELTELQKALLCDPQTSGGLLIAVQANQVDAVNQLAQDHGFELTEIGQLMPHENQPERVRVF